MSRPLIKKRKPLRVIYVASYIPRKCGIATFTKDLTNAINLLNPYTLSEIMALNRPEENLEYPWEVKYKIDWHNLNSYLQAAAYINQSGADVVMLEHEFGLCGGHEGDYIIPFVESIKKPLVITCHTVIEDSNGDYGIVLRRLVARADAIVVMMNESAKKLVKKYDVPRNKIAVIPHGTPDLAFNGSEIYKKKKKLVGRLIIGNINLISEIKGLEYTIEATAKIAKVFPEVLCLIVGQTHPAVLREQGEKYRNYLVGLVRKYGISKNVKFVNEYVSLEELIQWLRVIDIYVTPYLDPQQSASGALAYAVGAGKPCVSTLYLYAKEVLNKGKGILVPFRNSEAIAKAVIGLWQNPEKRKEIERRAYDYGRLMTWSSVALQHLDLFSVVLKKKNGEK